jgi:hypothetical protein
MRWGHLRTRLAGERLIPHRHPPSSRGSDPAEYRPHRASALLGGERDEASKLSGRSGALDIATSVTLTRGRSTPSAVSASASSRERPSVSSDPDVRTATSAPAGVWRTWYSSA